MKKIVSLVLAVAMLLTMWGLTLQGFSKSNDVAFPVLLPTGKMSAPMKPSVSLHPDYKKLVDMSRELKETLMPGTAQPEEEPAVKETEPVKCPWCGSMVTPDEEGCCPECTGPVSGR